MKIKCPVCHQEACQKIWSIQFFNGEIAFCAHCQLYFMENPPSERRLLNYYCQKGFKENFFFRLVRSIIASVRAQIQFDYLKAYLPSAKKILEVGAGKGFLKKVFNQKGYRLDIVEPGLKTSKGDSQKIFSNLDQCLKSGFKYDLLIFSHSLEHFPSLKKLFNQIKKITHVNSKIFIELPQSPLPKEVPEIILQEYLNTTHLFNFTRQSLIKLLKKLGWKTIQIRRYHYQILPFFNHQPILKAITTGRGSRFHQICGLINILYLYWRYRLGLKCEVVNLKKSWLGWGDWLQVIAQK